MLSAHGVQCRWGISPEQLSGAGAYGVASAMPVSRILHDPETESAKTVLGVPIMARLTLLLTILTTLVAILGGFRYFMDTIREMRWRKQKTGKWLLAVALCFLPSLSDAACSGSSPTRTAASTSQTDVNDCITASVDGDTINIPAGTSTWNARITIPDTKGIVLSGAGTGSTNITFGTCTGGALGHMEVYIAPGNSLTRVTAISFTFSNTGCNSDEVNIYVNGYSTTPNFRFDHNEFKNVRSRGIQLWSGSASADLWGLIDNNLFQCLTTGTSAHPLDFNGYRGGDGEMWERQGGAPEWGTNKFVFVEDNEFDMVDMADNVFDAYGGAKFVFRNNIVRNTMPGVHGADSGSRRGVHSFEIYRNEFTNELGTDPFTAFQYRSGAIMQWGNTWEAGFGNSGNLRLYRITDTDTYPPWGMCNGTKIFDGNGSPTGYPCLDQVGWRFDDGYTSTTAGTRTLTPIYFWENTQGGSAMAAPDTTGLSGYVNQNREYYTSTGASCTGGGSCTTGVGVGTSLPTTCTTGVGFWKTNEGTWDSVQVGNDGVLYICTSTNTWTLSYTPYTYPHPLQGLGGGDSGTPSSLILFLELLSGLGMLWHWRAVLVNVHLAGVTPMVALESSAQLAIRLEDRAKTILAVGLLTVLQRIRRGVR